MELIESHERHLNFELLVHSLKWWMDLGGETKHDNIVNVYLSVVHRE